MANVKVRLKDASESGNTLHPETEWEMVTDHPTVRNTYLLEGTVDGYAWYCSLVFNGLAAQQYTGVGYFINDLILESDFDGITSGITSVGVRASKLTTSNNKADYSAMDITITFAGGTSKKFVPAGGLLIVNPSDIIPKIVGVKNNRQTMLGADGCGPYSFTRIFSTMGVFSDWVRNNPFVAMASKFFFIDHIPESTSSGSVSLHPYELKLDFNWSAKDRDTLKLMRSPSSFDAYLRRSFSSTDSTMKYEPFTSLDPDKDGRIGVILGLITYSPSYDYDFNWEALANSFALL